MRILVIEDEAAIADFIDRGLRAEGYEVESVGDGNHGLDRALTGAIDLVVLDRMLPGRDGLDVLVRIRAVKPALPVIMLTARAGVADRVDGLDAGATDYLVKPFAFDELAARVRAHLRTRSEAGEGARLAGGGLTVDLLSREVRADGAEVRLSSTEYDLLVFLMRHPGVVVSRERILEEVWGYGHDPGTNVVDVYISYLRRKL
ncbi:MAG: response regulator transcription factor, partial [Actinobacteria bacterium]|nr:response regulator transcription factor [Actinomycetota bacterium]